MNLAEDFDAFVAIVDAGSISEAARELGVARASLSRQLARLEERLGVRLLHRTTRRLVPSKAGEVLYPRARAVVEESAAAVEAVRLLDDVPRGLLRVSAPPTVSPSLGELIAAFMLEHPLVQVELIADTSHVDLASERVDVAMRAGVMRDPNLISRSLFRLHTQAFASASYVARHGTPTTVEDLADHECIRRFISGRRPATSWPLVGGGEVPVDGAFVSNDVMALMGALRGGLGIGLAPRELVAADVQSGNLVPVLDGIVGLETTASLVWLERRFLDPKVRAFVDFITEAAKKRELLGELDAARPPDPPRE